MAEIEIGLGKSARRSYGLDEISIVPSRRTRDPECVDIAWEVDAFRFELPLVAAPSDSVVSPATAVRIAELGGIAALSLEGLWTRYEDPNPLFEEISALEPMSAASTARMQEIYAEPIRPDLVTERINEINSAGVVSCGAVSPQRAQALAKHVIDAELDLLVIQGPVISAEHVSKTHEPLNLKTFVREFDVPVLVGGCVSYQSALHLMRTGAAGVLVGVFGGGSVSNVLGVGASQATAISDVQAARMRHLDETGVYVHVVAAGAMSTGGDIAKAVACGADAVMLDTPLAAASDAPAPGRFWSAGAVDPALPTTQLVDSQVIGPMQRVLLGPSDDPRGGLNLFGALRASMASCGYESLKEFQKADVAVVDGPRTNGRG